MNWHDKPPVNGREFTAYDVEHHYDRILGSGSGFTVPSSWHRARMENVQDVTATDKYTAVLTTSIHFFDHTAHNYMQSICDDLEMRFAGAFSAEMHDLRKPEGQKQTRLFGEIFIEIIKIKNFLFI